MAEQPAWRTVELPEGSDLVKKELFDFQCEKGQFLIELFETMDGKFYAIGTDKDPNAKMVIYGSHVVSDKRIALQTVLEKIDREGTWVD
ncbi:hypothetical protein [Effusibacillus dendaii]|uniref:Uncharacterized protein n=1 Tax=Effusibacillus dendaii TaxID=2743772 RepID=A0A7I8DF25_9BACL|nr:hypothetical protein [Effusibacillus dendaii]BCJ86511.1 hypothetical protein skT53_14960 [Effusibacillus dendaii]